MILAIATQNPNAPSETYVRQHLRELMPGSSVGLALDCQGDPPGYLPILCIDSSQPQRLGKLSTLGRLLFRGYANSLTRSQEERVRQFFRQNAVDTVLAEFGTTGAALRQLCKKDGIRLFVNFHGHDATVMASRAHIRYAYRLLNRDARGFICGSEYFRKKLYQLGFDCRKTVVIPCGVDPDKFYASTNRDPRKVIAIGRLTAKKAPLHLIRAFDIAKKAVGNCSLEVIGDGPLYSESVSLIEELGLADSVTLHGATSHEFVCRRLAEAGIFAQHSLTAPNGDQESQGISLLEAMASSLPVVATDHNGFCETVVHGETGFLSPERDVSAMAENLIQIMS